MIRKTINLTAKQAAELKRLAKQRNVSVAELVRRAVDMVIGLEGVTGLEERRRRALSIAGRFNSGRSDLSSYHDKHLAEAFK